MIPMRSAPTQSPANRSDPRYPLTGFLGGTLVLLGAMLCSLFGHGELELRIAAISRQIATNDTNASLFLERADLHRLHLDWPAASVDLDRARALAPDLVTVGLARARLLRDSGRPTEAREAFDDYLRRAPIDGVALVERARMRAEANELKPALADYDRALSFVVDPLPEYYLERAELAVRLGDREVAIRGLDEGQKRLGVIVTLQSRAVELELERKDYDAALRRLETIIARANRRELWLEKKGMILRQAGRHAEATAAFQASAQAIAKLPARLQTTPIMESLKARLQTALKELAANVTPAPTNRQAQNKSAQD